MAKLPLVTNHRLMGKFISCLVTLEHELSSNSLFCLKSKEQDALGDGGCVYVYNHDTVSKSTCVLSRPLIEADV